MILVKILLRNMHKEKLKEECGLSSKCLRLIPTISMSQPAKVRKLKQSLMLLYGF
jgi:hypothetical protein